MPYPRTGSLHSPHQLGASWPSSYRSTLPPGSANRRFRSMFRPEIFGFTPSHTLRPDSSWLNPSMTNSFRNVPDCELPSEMDQLMRPASGFGVPAASCFSYLKNELMSLVAASPTPSTSGSFAM